MYSRYGMARPLRIQEAGLTYHLTSRGNGRMDIFLDDDDRHQFLEGLWEAVQWFELTCSAYCLMGNHYHLIVRTREANLSRAVRDINGSYAQWWNRRHKHVGHVFQGRFNGQIVQDEGYFVTACRYVVLNPVRAGMARTAAEWRWSSYAATAGLIDAPAFLDCTLLHRLLGPDVSTAMATYRNYIAAAPDGAVGTLDQDPILGDATFEARFKAWRERASLEVPRVERTERPPSLDELFAHATTRAIRTRQVVDAQRYGYSAVAIAEYLGMHRATISRMIRSVKGVRSRKMQHCKT